MYRNENDKVEAFHRGMDFYAKRNYKQALDEFRKALACDTILEVKDVDPLYLSYYGLTLAKVKRKLKTAQKLCRMAKSRGENYPDVFVNLGDVYVQSGRIDFAVDIYREGYRLHRRNVVLLTRLQRYSPRGRTILPFLNRDNFLNKYGGIIVHRSIRIFKKKPQKINSSL